MAELSPQAADELETPQAIIFDIGRVIVRVNLARAFGTLGAQAGLSAEQVWAAIRADPLWRDWQEGRVSPHEWHEHLARRLSFPFSFEQFRAAWNSALEPETLLGDNLFAKLAARYRLVLLSNTDPLHVEHLDANFGFPRYFPARVYSCTVGASKPQRAIFERAIHEAGAAPSQILYVDDAEEYVAAGCRLGLQGYVFQGAEPFLAELRRRSMLIS